jgi:hypothetical protein
MEYVSKRILLVIFIVGTSLFAMSSLLILGNRGSGMKCRGILSVLNFVKITEYGWKVVIE